MDSLSSFTTYSGWVVFYTIPRKLFPIHVHARASNLQDVGAKQKSRRNHDIGHILCRDKKQTSLQKKIRQGIPLRMVIITREYM